jgi:DNA mismatch repair protein MutS
MKLSPMMEQYMEIKKEHTDCILFFRLGDFYEMFFEDAHVASKELELTLTGKNCGQEERAPMCGVPFHAAESYISKLVELGHKVAVCEQVEDPALAKGIVRREVVQIITPGTISNGTMLNEKENNYLASVYMDDSGLGFSYCDISTGEWYVTELPLPNAREALYNELARIGTREIIIPPNLQESWDLEELKQATGAYLSLLDSSYYQKDPMIQTIYSHFQIKSLTGLGLGELSSGLFALGALLKYLLETQKQGLSHLKRVQVYHLGGTMALDKATLRNLEITETLYEKKIQGSLLGVLDKTHTAMGSRKMKKWLREPLNRCQEIQERLDAVDSLIQNYITRNNLKESLKAIYDFERLTAKIACGSANGKDLIALKNSLFVLPEIKLDLMDCDGLLLQELQENIFPLEEVHNKIAMALVDDPPFTIKEGGLIQTGYSEELDTLKASISDAQRWIASLENIERERTGISNLKVGYNRVFGYYIEITRSKYDLIPDNYIRKQTLVNAERFITPELKEMESLVLHAEVKINLMEYEIFIELRNEIKGFIDTIQRTSQSISSLDVLVSFAEVSTRLGYVKPIVHEGDEIRIEKGRHPVIEQSIRDGVFVPNDTYIDCVSASMLLITGPNMAGKSTYMRQTALIVLMAQTGCFVPCEAAVIGIVDRIFTRIGASDNLAQGQSTFFVEMSELAYILRSATEKSLILLDEIGRGTSTYDGLSIAWSLVEYLCNDNKHIRTLFATHYHELTSIEGNLPGFKNLTVDVADENGKIVFLHKIVEGSASKSYGIHVAQLAGVPKELLENANIKLEFLESLKETDDSKKPEEQLSLFRFEETND